jgi:thiosulfate reductase cytochrome b subunit
LRRVAGALDRVDDDAARQGLCLDARGKRQERQYEKMHSPQGAMGHARWVRFCHWIAAVAIVTLGVTGYVILMAHPRLYWGETGNGLTPALLELPISRNHQHGGWQDHEPILDGNPSVVSANQTYDIFNQNSWGRSLHFLSAWGVVAVGLAYAFLGFTTGHFRSHLWPRLADLAPQNVMADVVRHLRRQVPAATGGPDYGLLQKCAYSFVVFVALPLAVLTGLAMSPRVAAAVPVLGFFGGFQSARTLHFAAFVVLVLFAVAHVVMVLATGFSRHMRGMTIGDRP